MNTLHVSSLINLVSFCDYFSSIMQTERVRDHELSEWASERLSCSK